MGTVKLNWECPSCGGANTTSVERLMPFVAVGCTHCGNTFNHDDLGVLDQDDWDDAVKQLEY